MKTLSTSRFWRAFALAVIAAVLLVSRSEVSTAATETPTSVTVKMRAIYDHQSYYDYYCEWYGWYCDEGVRPTVTFKIGNTVMGSLSPDETSEYSYNPAEQSFTVTDPAILAAIGDPGCNQFIATAEVPRGNGNILMGYIRVEITRPSGTETVTVHDVTPDWDDSYVGYANWDYLSNWGPGNQYTKSWQTAAIPDSDGDGINNCADPDTDNDGVLNAADNCPFKANPNQADYDGVNGGDACDMAWDLDRDGIANTVDNCPSDPNPTQSDYNGNGQGDACDGGFDSDSDGVPNVSDNCPANPNAAQGDSNLDGVGDACSAGVVAVPWLGSEALAHEVYSGGSLRLQAVASNAGTGAAITLASGTWDAGDGTGPQAIDVSNSLRLQADHVYTGANNQPFTATVRVVTSSGAVYTDTMKIVIKPNTRDTRVNMAIDKGLWNLHTRMQYTTSDSVASAYWTTTYGQFFMASTASTVQAFEINNHRESGDASKDPYVNDVTRGLRYILSSEHGHLNRFAPTMQNGNNPDADGNGSALGVNHNANDHSSYITGQVMDAIVASGTPNKIAVTGENTYVKGRTYRRIIQDMLDGYSWGMADNTGGWHYAFQDTTGSNDTSASHWWAIGVLAARTWNLDAPDWVKDIQRSIGIPLMQAYPGDGHFGYTDSTGSIWDDATNVTAAGLILMNADEMLQNDPRFVAAMDYLKQRFVDSTGNFYTMYQTTKAMRTAYTAGLVNAPIDMLAGTIDWQAGYDDYLVSTQTAAGAFTSPNGTAGTQITEDMATSWGVIMLSPSLFELPPSAACSASPNTIGTHGGLVNFTAAASFHPDATKQIVSYSWNFGDGSPAASGLTTSHNFAQPASFPTVRNVLVTVTDSSGMAATSSCPVTIVDTNVPPNAVTGGPYTICSGASLTLDGSHSTDENGTIASYKWDWSSPVNFTAVDASTAVANATAAFASRASGVYDIGLQVTDNDGATSSAFSTVTVLAANDPSCNQPPVIAVPANIVIEATSPNGAVATFAATATDDHDTLTPVCTPASGSTFGINVATSKVTTVNCSVTDNDGLSASGAFTVTVKDTTPPVITVPSPMTIHATSSAGANVNFAATATDIVDVTVPTTCNRVSGSLFPMGLTTVTCNATDKHNNPSSTTFTVNVTNAAPVAVNDAVTAHGQVSINVLANDTDADGDPLSVSIVTGTVNGSVFVQGDKTVKYLPNPSQANNDSFSYQISDGRGGVSTATVAITVVNAKPTPANDTITLAHNVSTVNIPVLLNDTDADGDTFQVWQVFNSPNCHCSPFVINADGTVTYTSPAGPAQFSSPATFTYTIRDQYGAISAPATVTVIFPNQPPTANQIQVTTHGQPVTVNLLSSASDPDGDAITLVGACGGFNNPSVGFCNFNVAAGTLTFTPNFNWHGPQIQLGYTITDGHSANASSNVRITYVNQLPVPAHLSFTTNVNTDLPLNEFILLAGSTDPDGDELSIENKPTALHGTLVETGPDAGVYRPNPGFIGMDTLTYDVDDQHGGVVTTTATVKVVAPTTTTVSAPDVVYGSVSTITVNVGSAATSIPTGVVTVRIQGSGSPLEYSATLNNGVATIQASLPAQFYTVTASYLGEGFFLASTGSTPHLVTPAPTTTVVSCTPTVVFNGSAYEVCTATVSGVGINTQTVPVTYTSNVNVGTATASASYAGDANNVASQGSATFQITLAPTTTVISCSDTIYNGAAQETCTANVTGAGGFSQTLPVTYLNNVNVGTAKGSASFAGDANHSGSDASATFAITAATTTTVITCSNAVYNGAAQETCTASVSGAGGFSQTLPVSYADNVNVGTAKGSASYTGDANHSGSDASATFEITKATTTTVISCSNAVYNATAQESCTASVSGAGGLSQTLPVTYGNNVNVGTATGSASYAGDANHTGSDANTTFQITPASSTTVVTCPASVVYSGAAQTVCSANVTGVGGLNQTLAVTYANNTAVGTASASASFAGDANHNGSSNSTTFEITQAATTTSINAPTIMVAANGTVTVSVASGSGMVLGNVSLTVDGGAAVTQALVNGSSVFTVNSPNAGDHALAASYAAQGNFAASGATGNLHVNPAPTKTVLATTATPQLAGQAVTFTATVTATAPGTGTPNGVVTFKEGATVLGTGTLNAAGVATFSTTTLSNGPHTITAVYNGVNNYLTSTSNTVDKLIFGLASGGGTFVIADTNATLGKAVNFWGSQWEKSNIPSGGTSNASFKGFATTPAVPTVGATFTAAPGNSAPQPSTVPQYIGIIVTSKVTKSGSSITGTIVKLVVVKVDAGYVADPGHAGTGTIVAFIQ